VKANNVKYTVGYNKGMAPLIRKSRDLIKEIDKKKLIYHRIQAPFSTTHWMHDPAVGGGRLAGEGCRIQLQTISCGITCCVLMWIMILLICTPEKIIVYSIV